MTEQLLANVTQDQFDTAEETLMDLIRTAYPSLDLRRGTVIRDLLVRPAAAVYAMNSANMDILTNKMSLSNLENDATATADDYNAILANFGTSLSAGTVSSGQLIVTVDSSREYTIGANFVFTDINGYEYQTTQEYSVSPDASGTQIELVANEDEDETYYFILPVSSVAAGSAGNIQQGTALTPVSDLYGFISASAYNDFSGGTEPETIAQALQRLPATISYRALESRTSIDAKLRDAFASSSIAIQAVSVAGYADRTQLRHKHNPMGFAVGSRVDVYARTYTVPRVITLQKTGTLTTANTYQFTIDADDAPGFYAIRSISEVESVVAPSLDFGTLYVVGSYPFTEVRSATGLTDTAHDISAANSVIESAYTCYQQSVVTVTGVPDAAAEHEFKIEVYVGDGIQDIQDYVDDPAVCNVEADYLVRSPLMCLVGMQAVVYCDALNPVDAEVFKAAVAEYINTRSFVTQLTRSELVKVMLGSGATRVDLGLNGMSLFCSIRDAAGTVHEISGDSLNLESIADADVLLAPETCVFATEVAQLQITVVTE